MTTKHQIKATLLGALIGASAMLFTATPTRADHLTDPIPCDFTALEEALDAVELSDVKAPNNNARRGRLKSLDNALEEAIEAAEEGDIDEVLEALNHIAKKSSDRKNAWIRGDAADEITAAIEELRDCLAEFEHDDDEEDEEEEE